MIHQLLSKIQALPPLFLGFMVILILLVGLVYKSPRPTLCDLQMKEVNARLAKGFFHKDSRGGGFQAQVMVAFDHCLQSNSPGGCLEMFTRLNYLEKVVSTLPSSCGRHPSTASLSGFLTKGARLLVLIAWGEKPPAHRYQNTAWLETSDLGLFCRLKRQFQRLYGKKAWRAFAQGVLPRLPEAEKMDPKDRWEKSLFSYPCQGLY